MSDNYELGTGFESKPVSHTAASIPGAYGIPVSDRDAVPEPRAAAVPVYVSPSPEVAEPAKDCGYSSAPPYPYGYPGYTTAYGTAPSAEPASNNSFYNEKVKKSGKKSGALKSVAIIAAVSSLCFGLGLGTMLPVSQAFFANRVTPAQTTGNTSGEGFSLIRPGTDEPVNTGSAIQASSDLSPDSVYTYSGIISRVEPSVVCITAKSAGTSYNFWGGTTDMSYAGSGILFHETDTKYYIATNYHVISADGMASGLEISVSVAGSALIPAKVVGFNGEHDLAVISIEKTEAIKTGVESVHLAVFGDSSSMKVGDAVLAIGNAMGEGNTATNGIISAKDKTIAIENKTLEVLQTNAAINPGNSGGPLINLKGEVIGINTAKISAISADGVAEGMGYSIPSDVARPIIEDLMNVINKAYLGVTCGTITEAAAKQYSLPSAGAYVNEVAAGSPAEKAGLKATDIITSFNGMPVLSSSQLVEYVQSCKIGDKVEIKVIRDGKDYLTLNAELGQR